MKIAFTILLLFALLSSPSKSEIIENVVYHQKICYKKLDKNLSDNKDFKLIISIPEEGIFNASYSCPQSTYIKAKNISALRPNGSEVFALIWGDAIFDLDICHIHDDKTIECGEPLKVSPDSF